MTRATFAKRHGMVNARREVERKWTEWKEETKRANWIGNHSWAFVLANGHAKHPNKKNHERLRNWRASWFACVGARDCLCVRVCCGNLHMLSIEWRVQRPWLESFIRIRMNRAGYVLNQYLNHFWFTSEGSMSVNQLSINHESIESQRGENWVREIKVLNEGKNDYEKALRHYYTFFAFIIVIRSIKFGVSNDHVHQPTGEQRAFNLVALKFLAQIHAATNWRTRSDSISTHKHVEICFSFKFYVVFGCRLAIALRLIFLNEIRNTLNKFAYCVHWKTQENWLHQWLVFVVVYGYWSVSQPSIHAVRNRNLCSENEKIQSNSVMWRNTCICIYSLQFWLTERNPYGRKSGVRCRG